MTDTKKLTKKEPSKNLRDAIHDMIGSFQKTAASIDRVFSIGRNEGFSDMEIGNMIRKEMLSANYDPRTIRRTLPPSAKHVEKAREQKDFADKMSANEHEPTHLAQDAEPKAHERPTIERQQSVTEQSKQAVQDRVEFGLARISTLPENKKLLKFEIPIPKNVFWNYVEAHMGEAYSHFPISGEMNQETGKILSLSMGKDSISKI